MGSLKYKRPFYRTSTFQILIFPFFVLIYVVIKHVDGLKFWEWSTSESLAALIVGSYCGVCVWIGVFRQMYYIQIDDNRIELKNGIVGGIRKICYLDDKIECMIAYERSRTIHYVRFRSKGKVRWGRYYGIDLVDPKDLKEIISILESKGVTVITKDLKDV